MEVPRFPIEVVWFLADETDRFDDELDLITGLEDFDSDDPAFASVAFAVDAEGRRLQLKVSMSKGTCDVRFLADT